MENHDILFKKYLLDPCPFGLLSLYEQKPQTVKSPMCSMLFARFIGFFLGPAWFRPRHLLELVNHRQKSVELLGALTDLVNVLWRSGSSSEARPVHSLGKLCAETGGKNLLAPSYLEHQLGAPNYIINGLFESQVANISGESNEANFIFNCLSSYTQRYETVVAFIGVFSCSLMLRGTCLIFFTCASTAPNLIFGYRFLLPRIK